MRLVNSLLCVATAAALASGAAFANEDYWSSSPMPSPSEIGFEDEPVVIYVIPEPEPVEVWIIEPAS